MLVKEIQDEMEYIKARILALQKVLPYSVMLQVGSKQMMLDPLQTGGRIRPDRLQVDLSIFGQKNLSLGEPNYTPGFRAGELKIQPVFHPGNGGGFSSLMKSYDPWENTPLGAMVNIAKASRLRLLEAFNKKLLEVKRRKGALHFKTPLAYDRVFEMFPESDESSVGYFTPGAPMLFFTWGGMLVVASYQVYEKNYEKSREDVVLSAYQFGPLHVDQLFFFNAVRNSEGATHDVLERTFALAFGSAGEDNFVRRMVSPNLL